MMDRPIAFNRAFIELGLSVKASLMLSQAVYWSRRTTKPGGWFYKTQDEWFDEIGLRRREQEAARRDLREAGFLDEKKMGVPCKVFYRVNQDALSAAILSHGKSVQPSMHGNAKLECTGTPCSDAPSSQTITESTAETTSESTQKPSSPDGDVLEVFEYWREKMGKTKRVKLDAKRKGKIRGRLKDGFTVDDIKQAIDGCAGSSFHMGDNKGGTKHDDLELICRDSVKVEMFMGMKTQAPRPTNKHRQLSQATADGMTADAQGGFRL